MAEYKDPENTILMELKGGTVVIELLADIAPKHCERMKVLARAGAYDHVIFHRVIDGFMAQSGDVAHGNAEKDYNPRRAGTGGSDMPDLPAEFSPPGKARFVRGTCGMARTQNPNSATSQFVIMFAPAPSLDGQYTIWGQVTAGMDAVDKIKRGAGMSGVVQGPDKIRSIRVASDAA